MDKTPKMVEGDIVFYRTPEGTTRIEVLYESETFWLNQKKIAELFGVELHTISYHLKEIYASGELSETATLRKIRRVQREGNRDVSREIDYYNLDAIISVGYRVNSAQATRFRIWATQTLREFIVKGFVLDDDRLKLKKRFGKDYFDELLERIREIRASERRFYLKIVDIYEQCSIDYDKDAEITKTFFKTVQNKLHWAVTGQTRRRDHRRTIRCRQTVHGPHHLEKRPRGENPQVGCCRGEELSDRGRDQGVGADRRDVSGLCRKSGRSTNSHADGRLGRTPRRFPEIQ